MGTFLIDITPISHYIMPNANKKDIWDYSPLHHWLGELLGLQLAFITLNDQFSPADPLRPATPSPSKIPGKGQMPCFSKRLRSFSGSRIITAVGLYNPVYIKATTMALAGIVFSQIGAVFNCRTEKQSVFQIGLFSNRQVNFGIIFEIFLILALIFLSPLQSIFHTAALDWQDLLLLCAWPPLILLIEEARKALARKKDAKNNPAT